MYCYVYGGKAHATLALLQSSLLTVSYLHLAVVGGRLFDLYIGCCCTISFL